MNLEKMAINEIAKLEISLFILADMLGENDPMVKALEIEIRNLNLELLAMELGA